MTLWIDEQVLQMFGLVVVVLGSLYLWIMVAEKKKNDDK